MKDLELVKVILLSLSKEELVEFTEITKRNSNDYVLGDLIRTAVDNLN